MKIEKINDNKIRCTLTSADLAERNLKLSELAYGTEKARSLFQDMMLEASSLSFKFLSARSALVSVQRILLSLIFSIFITLTSLITLYLYK
jgi:negative regulator of genetic competence, sporulation and motility